MKTSRFVLDVATGLLAGWVGLQAKGKAESTLQGWGEKVFPPAPGQKELPGADPTGHGDRMPPSVLYRRLVDWRGGDGDALEGDDLEAGAVWFHRALAYGYPVAYSVISRRIPLARAGAGTLGGAALFGAFHATVLPVTGVQASLSELPKAWWVWEGGSHLVFGVAVDLVVGTVRRVTG
ncbi:hypothetical protein GTR02_00345 [Kineococcus sp. R8]|uniref:hypothetical protein n=1 Tax=Kineococcus siccus TaxID=2696567 RepID=UPI0014122D73|nr:hypothetical protein [Kineococcus siccus]NAZ80270.1 hypothetical protein [Kineococcus siccus]